MPYRRHTDRRRLLESEKKRLYISSNLGTKRKLSNEILEAIRVKCPEEHWATLINISLADHHGHPLSEVDQKLCAAWRSIEMMARQRFAAIRPEFNFIDHCEVTYNIWFKCKCCNGEFNRCGSESPKRRSGGKICKWCYDRCRTFSDKKYSGCDSRTDYLPEEDEMSVFGYEKKPTPEARKLISVIDDHHTVGETITVDQIKKIAPPGCFTPSRNSLSVSVMNQLVKFGILEKNGKSYSYTSTM
jgi:hypothetical protein